MIVLVLGGAKSVWDDLAAAKALLGDRRHMVVACNDVGAVFPDHLDAWVSLHPEHMARWATERAGNSDYRRFVPVLAPGPAAEVVPERWPGSSGLYALQIALTQLISTSAILCGIPMDSQAGHIRQQGVWASTSSYRQAFEATLPVWGGRTRSMSGWTSRLYGQPTAEWLAAVANIKPLVAERLHQPRSEPMHKVENVSDSTQRFHVREPDGQLKLIHLAPGDSGNFDIDPLQPRFNGDALKVAPTRAKPTLAPVDPAQKQPS